MRVKDYIVIGVLVALGVATRFLPHEYNISALGAAILFSGFLYKDFRAWCVILPLLVVQDWYFGWYEVPVMISVYASYGAVYALGRMISARPSLLKIMGYSLSGSVLFYILTNGAVALFTPYYPHSLQGLFESYYLGLPFWRNSVMGDLGYGILMFKAYEYVPALVKRWTNKSLQNFS